MNIEVMFNHIYNFHLWGKSENENPFYSGEGSHNIEHISKYIDIVNSFIKEHNIHSVVDLGCGDFNVGSKIIVDDYTGCDIVKRLIEYNDEHFSDSTHRFIHLNAVDDELPNGELLLVKECLQHLEVDDVLKIYNKFKNYKYVIVCDNMNMKSNTPNVTDNSCYVRCIGSYYDFEREPFLSKNVKKVDVLKREGLKKYRWRITYFEY